MSKSSEASRIYKERDTRRVPLSVSLWRTFVSPLLSAALSAAAGALSLWLFGLILPPLFALVAAAAVFVIVFIVAVFLTRALERDELIELPLVGRFARQRNK